VVKGLSKNTTLNASALEPVWDDSHKYRRAELIKYI
jgi:hypothetical protein